MNPLAMLDAAGVEDCRPWPRRVLSRPDWSALVAALKADAQPALLALWADTAQVHALLLDEAMATVLPVSVAVEAGRYPALSPARPLAAWFERLVHDLWGHVAEGGRDARPWLDHGRWPHAQPMAPRPGPPSTAANPPELLPAEAEDLMQVPLGPVHGLIGEAMHVRLTARGDAVLRAESRLGYTHKGTLVLMRGKSPRAAARFAARLAGDATVAHSLAFARATEAALDMAAPPRAAALRAAMLELERVAGHLDALAVQADAAGLAGLHSMLSTMREHLLRGIGAAFGHRLMMDCVVPGGLAADVAPDGVAAILAPLEALEPDLPLMRRRCQALLGRLDGLGVVSRVAAFAWAAGGVVGRAAGRAFDVRRFDPACPAPTPPEEHVGDAATRGRVRLAQIADGIRLVRAVLAALPEGPVSVALPTASGEGIGCAESVRGDVWHWLRLDHGQIAAAFTRDPGWSLWPLAEAAIAGARVEEADAILHSFGLAASPVDL
ncbi:MAG TPA: hydrogenase expression protein HypE [Acetobacteraceae bacterium]|jgi:Ni,Fe-hydrogenase III large subunit